MKQAGKNRISLCPSAELLEDRCLLSLTIQLDYSLDSKGFFDDPSRRVLLQTVADTIGSRLNDNLLAINPSGGNTWSADFDNPATGVAISIPNMAIPANTIRVFAAGRPLSGTEVGNGEFGGYSASGSNAWLDIVAARGQLGAHSTTPTDFGPWGGAVSFDSNSFNNPAGGYFGLDALKLQIGQNDFLSVASHEIEHLLGFGTAPSWMDQITKVGNVPTSFRGPISNSFYDKPGPVPLSPDGGHWAEGLLDGNVEATMTPSLLQGTRKLPTRLDYAGLQDVGWSVTSDPDGTIGGAVDSTLHGLGLQKLTGRSIGPDVSDVDLYKFTGSTGQLLMAATSARAGGTTVDTYLRLFDSSGNELKTANNGVYDSLSFQLPADGTYYVGVSGAGNVAYSPLDDFARRIAGPVGDYDLSLSLDPATGGVTSDVSIQLTAPALAIQATAFTYTIGVMNHGPDPASSVIVTETLPAGINFVSTLVSQGMASFVSGVLTVNFGAIGVNSGAVIQVSVSPSATGPVQFAASVKAAQTDPNPNDNLGSRTTIIQPGVILPPPDITPPTITSFQVTTTGKGAKRITTIFVRFSEGLDPQHAIDVGAFFLSKTGKAKPRKPSPILSLPIKSLVYSPSDHTIRLTTNLAGVLPKGLKLTISASTPRGIRDLAGNFLDGDRNGIQGGDAILTLH